MQQKKMILENDGATTKKPDSNSVIYLIADKVAKYRPVNDNRRGKEETKKETSKKTSTKKVCLQQK